MAFPVLFFCTVTWGSYHPRRHGDLTNLVSVNLGCPMIVRLDMVMHKWPAVGLRSFQNPVELFNILPFKCDCVTTHNHSYMMLQIVTTPLLLYTVYIQIYNNQTISPCFRYMGIPSLRQGDIASRRNRTKPFGCCRQRRPTMYSSIWRMPAKAVKPCVST